MARNAMGYLLLTFVSCFFVCCTQVYVQTREITLNVL